MSVVTSHVGNDPHVSLEDATHAAPGPDGRSAQSSGTAADGARFEYVAMDAQADHESGMMGAGVSAPPALGNRQAHGQQHGGPNSQGHGLFNHGVLGVKGTMLGASDSDDPLDSHVGHLPPGGADVAEKKAVPLADHGKQEIHGAAEAPLKVASVEKIESPVATATVSEGHRWEFVDEILHPEGVHKIAPIADSTHDIVAGEGSQPAAAIPADIVAPDPLAQTPAPVPDSVPVPGGDAPADDGNASLGGKVDPGSRVSLYDNGALVDTVAPDADGNWNATPKLADGAHQLTAMAVDAAGHATVASDMRIVIAERSEQPAPGGDDIVIAGNEFNAGMVPDLMQGHDFAIDFSNFSMDPPAAGNVDAGSSMLSGHAPFALPDDAQMHAEDGGDGGVLQLDSASQLINLGALIQVLQAPAGVSGSNQGETFKLALGDVLEQGGKGLFTEDTHMGGNAGAVFNMEDLLAGAADGSEWRQAGGMADGGIDSAYQHPIPGLDLLLPYGADSQPA